ncbi:SDR family oxidoreductase [Kribbella pittospori]|uniref:SDR family oxidoreductase n=1 Tax=Kribbella pittospori TaxID=722689 RepID=A0A4V2M7C1_9ACTN|nr:SDR family oxidoreductase [Kribbella pittospori]TCC47012.1 SDR family oxidoreductase [Kribbella pittospori]
MCRSVLVTGASRGIGAATAQAFAAAGDRVAVHYGASADAAEAVLKSLPGSGHVLAHADLADPAAIQTMVDDAAAALGGIDVLVNNAGVYHPHRIREATYAEWQQAWADTIAVNLVGPSNVTWCAVRHMGRGGRIVNVSSRGAFRGEPNQPAYGASKAGIVSFTQSLARALGPEGIAVTAIAPGWTTTDMAAVHLTGDGYDRRRMESPLERVADPSEVAAAILYLASPEAEFATGTVLDFNGGSQLRM